MDASFEHEKKKKKISINSSSYDYNICDVRTSTYASK